jgi:predicted nucleotide-binding protein (sugar kinase/HSP70/actin superfamily)
MQGYACYKYYLKINIFYFKKYSSFIQKTIIDESEKTSSKIKCITKKSSSSFKKGSLNKIKEGILM